MSIFSAAGDAYRAVTSKTARRTYIYAILLTITSAILYGIAIIGYLGFYNEYVPHRVRSAPVHLQYSQAPPFPSTASTKAGSRLFAAETAIQQHLGSHPHHHPFALTDLRDLNLKVDQAYDVSVVLSVPRSPNNLAVGNFMVELALAASSVSSSSAAIAAAARLPPANSRDFLESGGKKLLFAAARPGLLAYTDPLVARATRLTLLPVHFFSPEAASRMRLVVPMAESLTFSGPGGPNAVLPAVLYLELRTGGEHELQTYGVEVVFSAKLRGLRWLMYHHPVFSFLLLTTTWWLIEVVFMVAVFVVLGIVFAGNKDEGYNTGRSDTGSSGTSRQRSVQRIEPKKETSSPAPIKKELSSAEKEPIVKKEPEEVSFSKETSKLASIPVEAVTTTNTANKDTKETKDTTDTKDTKDTSSTLSDSKDKGKQNKVPSRTSTPTPSKPANNRKSIINEPEEEGEDADFDDEFDDNDDDDEEDEAEPIVPPTPSRKQNNNKPQARTSSPSSPRKTNKGKDSAVATGRSPSSPTDGTPVRQRPPKKEASNLSTNSAASDSHGSPARKRMSQSLDDISHKPA